MSHGLKIGFNDAAKNNKILLDYCVRSSDSFSIITKLDKPYSKIPPNLEHHQYLESIESFLIEQVIGLREWPGTKVYSVEFHKVLNRYKCCKQTREYLVMLPNILLANQSNLPEDICFYRNEKPWLVTVSHENMIFMTEFTENDIGFLKKNEICYYVYDSDYDWKIQGK
jgi:hypothetical protein